MSNIKPGTLCILRWCVNPDNNGKIVTAIRRYQMDLHYPDGSVRLDWVWEVDRDLIDTVGRIVHRAGETQLIPITPPDVDSFIVDEVVKELCHEPA